MQRAIGILVLSGLLSAAAAAQGPPDAPSVVAADGYGGVVAALEPFIQRELAEKDIPALSIALVDDQKIVWARGFGIANPKDSSKASAATIYRVGSVSKLFTDIGVMRLVERGALDLDAPIERYLPDFAPHNPFRGQVSLRELMAHRAGLPLEAPVGSYVDSTTPSLAATVASLNEARLVYQPGAHTKYSNASAATAGYVIERTQNTPFDQWMEREVLIPFGLRHSGFTLTPDMVPLLAAGTMWTYEGRRFPAPTFPIGESPAIGLYSSVTDLSRFISSLFVWGRGPHGPALAPGSLAEMWRPQYDTTVDGVRYGLGFAVSSLDGHRRVGHAGAVYGFATDLALLPEDRLGVVVICTLDGTGPVVSRIADTALRLMLAHRAAKPLETPPDFAAVPPQTAARLEGWYHAESSPTKAIFLEAQAGKLYARSARGGQRLMLRAMPSDTLITDDRLGFGDRVYPLGYGVVVNRDTLWRAEVPQPTGINARWAGLIGEYGWDYNSLIILERGGRLMALVDWFQEYPLTEVGPDQYAFPEWGLYDGEHVAFIRTANGKATTAVAGGVSYDRRALGPDDGSQFRITPVRPIDELRKAALAAQPPAESGSFNPTDLVDVTSLDSTIKLDIRYATSNNFLGVPVYTEAKAYLQRPAAEALVRVNRILRRQGYGLLIHDAYRPWHVTKLFWDATPPEGKIFVADPSQGSNHNRGTAVDLTMFDTTSGKEVQMPGGYDEMSDRSYAYYPGGTSLQRWRRDFLRRLMEQQGFHVYEAEWWHFDFGDPKKFKIGNVDFEHLALARK
ncbi:MAG TPA: serine hydrolase [Gemmatimonadaceae bacterium]|nr:serine hydrolase [Gemmatimonadaceae bacterium]